MIRLFFAIGKCCKDIKKVSAHAFCQNMYQNVKNREMKCPNGCKGSSFHKDGTYQRQLLCYEKNAVVVHEVTIKCVECKECGQTHALLPSIVLPHSQFSIPFVVQLIQAYLVQRHSSVNEMCQVYDVSIATFYRLLHRFKRDWKKMLKLIQKYSESMDEQLLQFVTVPLLALDGLLERFYNKYHYSFLYSNERNTT